MSLILSQGAPVLAQVTSAPGLTGRTRPLQRRQSIDGRVSILAENLGLSKPQQAAVKNILERRQQEALRLRLDPSITGSARIERFRTLQDRTVERIRAVLNEEQKSKYDPLAVRGLSPAPDQRSVEDWLKLSAGSKSASEDQKP